MQPTEAELVRLVGSQMCAKWNTFAVYLGIEKHIRNEVSYKCLREPRDCFIEVVGQWLSHEDGTGDNPRTWETVFSALREIGFTLLVKEVTQKLSKRLGQSHLVEEMKARLFATTATEGKGRFCTLYCITALNFPLLLSFRERSG